MYVCKYFVSEGTLDVWNAELCLYLITTELCWTTRCILHVLLFELKVSELPDAVVADVDDDHVSAPLSPVLLLIFQVLHHSQPRRPLHLAAVRVYR